MKFEIPVEEVWVKRVYVGDATAINILFEKIDNKRCRAITIIGFSGEKILVSYEALDTTTKTEGE